MSNNDTTTHRITIFYIKAVLLTSYTGTLNKGTVRKPGTDKPETAGRVSFESPEVARSPEYEQLHLQALQLIGHAESAKAVETSKLADAAKNTDTTGDANSQQTSSTDTTGAPPVVGKGTRNDPIHVIIRNRITVTVQMTEMVHPHEAGHLASCG